MKTASEIQTIGLTPGQLRSFRYFFIEKGDVSRWSEWLELKPKLEKAFPEIMEQIEAMERAENMLTYFFNDVAHIADELDYK